MDAALESYKKDVDRTLIRETLKLTLQEHFLRLERFVELASAGLGAPDRGTANPAAICGLQENCDPIIPATQHKLRSEGSDCAIDWGSCTGMRFAPLDRRCYD